MSEAVLERISREHLTDVAALEALCFSEPWSERALELLLTDTAVGFVCLVEGHVVAYGGMLVAADEGQVTNVAVHPDHRRRGLGADIVRALCDYAEEKHLTPISLEVRASNTAAIALYKRFGFAVAGRRKHFYRKPAEDALVMLLDREN